MQLHELVLKSYHQLLLAGDGDRPAQFLDQAHLEQLAEEGEDFVGASFGLIDVDVHFLKPVDILHS